MSKFYQLEPDEWVKVCKELKGSEINVLFYIRTRSAEQPNAALATISDIAFDLKINKSTVSRAINRLNELGYLLDEYVKKQPSNPEKQVRDRLQSELGGQTEVITAVGRIDLLTDTQIIEVKSFSEWKSALGQILAYSAFFPTHQKRIHLFGNETQLIKLPDVEIACLSFDILVTGEVVS